MEKPLRAACPSSCFKCGQIPGPVQVSGGAHAEQAHLGSMHSPAERDEEERERWKGRRERTQDSGARERGNRPKPRPQ